MQDVDNLCGKDLFYVSFCYNFRWLNAGKHHINVISDRKSLSSKTISNEKEGCIISVKTIPI